MKVIMVTKTNIFALSKILNLLGCTASLKIGGVLAIRKKKNCELRYLVTYLLLIRTKHNLIWRFFYIYFERLKRQQKLIEALLKQSSCILNLSSLVL